MSTVNPQFQSVQIHAAVTENLGQNENIVSKSSGERFGKQGALSKLWTSMKTASAAGRHFVKKENQKTINKLETHLQRQGFSTVKSAELLSDIRNNADISAGKRSIQSQDIRALLHATENAEAKVGSATTQILHKLHSATYTGQSAIQGAIMGMVTSTSFNDLSPNQLHPIANSIVNLLTQSQNPDPATRLNATNDLLAELNTPEMKNLIEDMKAGILVSDSATPTPAPSPLAGQLMDLITFKLESQRASLTGQAQPNFSDIQQQSLTPASRKAHIETVMQPGAPVPQLMQDLGVKRHSFESSFAAYCDSLANPSKTFLRGTNPMEHMMAVITTPLQNFSASLNYAAQGLEKTPSGTEFIDSEPTPAGQPPSPRPQTYTQSYEREIVFSVNDFMAALNSNPTQKAAFLASFQQLFNAMERAIDNNPQIPDKPKRKIETLNMMLVRALPHVMDVRAKGYGEFSTLVSRGILLESPAHATTDVSALNSLRDMLAGKRISSLV